MPNLRTASFGIMSVIFLSTYGHGILQARILEWVAMPSSRGSSQPRVQTLVFFFFFFPNPCLLCLLHWQAGSLPLGPPVNPYFSLMFPNLPFLPVREMIIFELGFFQYSISSSRKNIMASKKNKVLLLQVCKNHQEWTYTHVNSSCAYV